jgi:hypothetical protein
MPKSSSTLIENKEGLLRFLKSRTHVYHLSNVFFRDFHYAILSFAESKGQKISYGDAEKLAEVFIASLETSGILKPVKPGSWMLNYPEFKKISNRPAAPAKAAAGQSASKPLASTQSASPGSSVQKAAADASATA